MVLIAPIVGAVVVLSATLTSALPTRRSEASTYDSYESNKCEGSGCEENKYEENKCEGSGCEEENKYTTPYEENKYTTEENKYTTEENKYTTEENKYTTEENKYTTTPYEENKYTTEENKYTTEENKYTTTPYEENKYTTEERKYTTTYEYEKDKYTTEERKYTTTYEENKYTTTSTAEKYHETYGSGKPYWGGSEYQDCVNKCIADFPSGSSESGSNDGGSGSNEKEGTYQANETKGSSGSKGTGATHTVVVAPSKGVFRMMPFHTKADVGDTIEFHWGADVHTVTQSSALTPCNKSAGETVFASGSQNKSFVFTQAVNNTDPIYYFCGTPTHCNKGMFGIINGESAEAGSPDSFSGAWPDMAAKSADLAALAAYSSNLTANNAEAASWGSTISMKNVPEELKPLYAENILFTRAALGQNPELLKNGDVDLSSVKDVPMMVPENLSDALNNAASSPAPTTPGAPGADNAQAAASSPSAPPTGGASSLASSRVLVGVVVVLATFFAL